MRSEEELLISDWFRRSRESQQIHYAGGNRYSQLNYLFGIPTIALAAAAGTAVFASVDQVASGSSKVVLIGPVSIAASVLASLQTFLRRR